VSCNRHINSPAASEGIGCKLDSFGFTYELEQNLSEPFGVPSIDVKRLAKDTRLVSTARMFRVQAIILDLPNIENRTCAVGQPRHPNRSSPAAQTRSPMAAFSTAHVESPPHPEFARAAREFRPLSRSRIYPTSATL